MSGFFTDLWESIFTPGTTPTLIRATHASFAALEITLISLCISTYNKHFLFMTLIATGLWAGITWFISELEKMKETMAQQNDPTKTEGSDAADNSIEESTEAAEKSSDSKKTE
ncbi:ER protein Pkr1-domain-containing protein [Dipodascopsis tothii]|uniref:ER protein Pkr1-domain-containing protein n=1 Tax=Dipodascopsis tothii TaxID=44089 RepID=UPI0034CE3DAB